MINHCTVCTKDFKATYDFYKELLGWEEIFHVNLPNMGEIVFLGDGYTKFEIAESKDMKNTANVESMAISLEIPNLDEKIAFLRSKGIESTPVIQMGPKERLIFFHDLNGARLQLLEKKD